MSPPADGAHAVSMAAEKDGGRSEGATRPPAVLHGDDEAAGEWESWLITDRRERIGAEAPHGGGNRRRWSLMRASEVGGVGGAPPRVVAPAGRGAKNSAAAGVRARRPRGRSVSLAEDELDSMTFVLRIAEPRDMGRHTMPAMPPLPSSDSMKQAVGSLFESGKALLSWTPNESLKTSSSTEDTDRGHRKAHGCSSFGQSRAQHVTTAGKGGEVRNVQISPVSSTASASAACTPKHEG
jgi:hypothetical protein